MQDRKRGPFRVRDTGGGSGGTRGYPSSPRMGWNLETTLCGKKAFANFRFLYIFFFSFFQSILWTIDVTCDTIAILSQANS